MSLRTLRVVGSFAALALLVLPSCATAPPPPSQPSPLLSRTMPNFDGETLSLNHFYSAQGNGYPMVVKFFSSKCSRCETTLPALQRVYEDTSNLIVIGVSEDDSAAEARRQVDKLGLHFPVMLDDAGKVAKQYRVAQVPATFVMSKTGSVTWVGGPDQTEDGLRAAIDAARD